MLALTERHRPGYTPHMVHLLRKSGAVTIDPSPQDLDYDQLNSHHATPVTTFTMPRTCS